MGNSQNKNNIKITKESLSNMQSTLKHATFGGGCFWCTEACLKTLKGVEKVISGYAGGTKENPTYREVCREVTGHAEVIQVHFDESTVSYLTLLKAFFKSHDPTQLNKQGNDVGTQYRSIILYHDNEQKAIAENLVDQLNKNVFKGRIVTQIEPFTVFYPAEDYHQDYYENNPNQGYCMAVVGPKLNKFLKEFKQDEV